MMEKQTNSSIERSRSVPSLRFPEFEGEWEKKKLGEVLTIGSGRDYKHLGEGEIPVFGTGGLMTKVDDYLYDGETVCIGRKGTIDKPMYFNGKIWTVDTLFYTHSFINSKPKFVYNLFQRVNWKQHNEAGGVPSLSKSTIEQIELVFPTLPEQTKIASFLTAVDEKIQALKKKHSLLEQYKKGVMQRIFSIPDRDAINRVCSLRFKDENGNDFPDWEEKKLGEVLIKNSTKNKNQKYSLVQSVSNKYGFINQDEMFEDRRVASKDTSNYYVIQKAILLTIHQELMSVLWLINMMMIFLLLVLCTFHLNQIKNS